MDVLNQGVKLALSGTLLLTALARNSNSNLVGKVANSLVPDKLVELGVDADIRSAHHRGHKSLDFRDSLGGLALELGAVSQLVDVDGGIDGSFGKSSPLFLLDHIY